MNTQPLQGFRKVAKTPQKQLTILNISKKAHQKEQIPNRRTLGSETSSTKGSLLQENEVCSIDDNAFIIDENSQNTTGKPCQNLQNTKDSNSMENSGLNIFCSGQQHIYKFKEVTKMKRKRDRKKEKSLSALTLRFLKEFYPDENRQITLQEIIKRLKVEKRRIYDVVNILEAFKAIFRTEKNCYLWCGLYSIEQTLIRYSTGQKVQTPIKIQNLVKTKGNKKKMLTSLSTKFIKFLLENPRSVTLEKAAIHFCDDFASQSKIKTKIRRLYDISNVFQALGLIEKTFTSKKPSYNWKGLAGFQNTKRQLISNQKNQIPKNNTFQKLQKQKMKLQRKKVCFEDKLKNMFKNVTTDRLQNHLSSQGNNRIPLFVYRQINDDAIQQMGMGFQLGNHVQNNQAYSNDLIQSMLQVSLNNIKKLEKRQSKVLTKRKRGKVSFESLSSTDNSNQVEKPIAKFRNKEKAEQLKYQHQSVFEQNQ